MITHVDHDAELYALGVLDPAERERVEGHVGSCSLCSTRLGEAEAVVARLSSSYFRASLKIVPLHGRPMRYQRMATAATMVLSAGIAVSSLLQTSHARDALRSNDAVLSTIATSHFNHTQFSKSTLSAPAAKLLNGRHGEWLYVVVDSPMRDLRVLGIRKGTIVDFGATDINNTTSTLFVRNTGQLERVELVIAGNVVENAAPSYARD